MRLFLKVAAMATVLGAIFVWRAGPQLFMADSEMSGGRRESPSRGQEVFSPGGALSPDGARVPSRGVVLWPPAAPVSSSDQDTGRTASSLPEVAPQLEFLSATSAPPVEQKARVLSAPLSPSSSFADTDHRPLGTSSPSNGLADSAMIYVHQGKFVSQLKTNGATVGSALSSADIVVGPGDLVAPGPRTPISHGLHIYLERAKEITLIVENVPQRAYSRKENVGAVLKEARIITGPLDIVDPPLTRDLKDDMVVTVVRVKEEAVVEEQKLDSDTEYRPTSDLERGQQRVVQMGSQGQLTRWITKRYENGQETSSVVDREELVQARNTIIEYGTKVVPAYLDTPSGSLGYWRKVRMYVTWYTASSAGKSIGQPGYGITRSGLPAGHGVVAVDPSVIPLFTRMYIPGYGPAIAGDTGGGVKGLLLDLGFDEDEPHTWRSGWIEVYIISPEPPANSPLWRLP